MDFLELISKRYSVRKYKDTHVSNEDIDKILLSAKLAPTARNSQPQEIIVVRNKESLSAIEKCTPCHYNAPLVFVVCYDSNKAWTRECDNKCSGDVDASIVVTQMMLEAAELDLGSTWIMNFDPSVLIKEFELKENIVPVALLYVGYADEEPSSRHNLRRDLQEYVTYR